MIHSTDHMKLYRVTASSFVLLCVSLLCPAAPLAQQENAGRPALSPTQARRVIAERARPVVMALQRHDMARLARFIHPSRGVRFSPYVSVNAEGDVRFTPREVRSAWRDSRRRVWGEADGTGDPIRLTFRRYYARYVYSKDFARAREVNYNTIMHRGNTLNNILTVHPQAILVEYHIPATTDGGLDWQSLWLIFERQGTEWFLVRIAHDEWTI